MENTGLGNTIWGAPDWAVYAGYLLLAYLIGAIPTGYLLVLRLTGQDIRTMGSGNTGATNVKRVMGAKWGYTVLFLDACKGFMPVFLARALFPDAFLLHVLTALFTVVGHSKSVFIKFGGGKSAATGLGGFFALTPVGGLLITIVGVSVIKATRMVSAGSITAGVVTPLIMYLMHLRFGLPLVYVGYMTVCAIYVIFLHKANIQRLLSGTENRF